LSWNAPESDGGSPIIGYHVERCLGQSSRWTRVTKDPVPDRTFPDKELIEDNVYEFRVYAVNKVRDRAQSLSPPEIPGVCHSRLL